MVEKKSGCIRILHISDLHVRAFDDQLKKMIVALEADIKNAFESFDFIVVTGDLTKSGQEDQYRVWTENILPRIRSATHVAAKNIIVVPGNHDVSRDLVSAGHKHALANLSDACVANEIVSEIAEGGGFKPFNNFLLCNDLKKGREIDSGFCRYKAHLAKDFSGDVYFACINTAWTCAADRPKGCIFLSERQLSYCEAGAEEADVSMAVMHHGIDYLHDSEHCLVDRMRQAFDIVLTGHVHHDEAIMQQTPSGSALFLTGACFAGDSKSEYNGYNVYDINPVDGVVESYYRKYITNRGCFAENVDYADHGRSSLAFKTIIPISAETKKRAVAYTYLPAIKDDVILAQLRQTQGLDNPVYIPPSLERVYLKDGRTESEFVEGMNIVEQGKDVLLYAPKECGKTIFLEKLSQELTESVYLDCGSIIRKTEEFGRYAGEIIKGKIANAKIDGMVLMLDHVNISDSNEIVELRDAVLLKGSIKNLIVSSSSEIVFEAALHNRNLSDVLKIRIRTWGVQTIEEFAKKYWAIKCPDKTPELDYLKTSLIHSDVPITPVIVGVFVSLFAMAADNASSANLVGLVDRITELKFGSEKYNYIDLLLTLACKLYNENRYEITLDEMRCLVSEYYDSRNLDYDYNRVQQALTDSRFISVDDTENVRFTYYIFRDYFIARALDRKKIKFDELTKTDLAVMSNASSLALFGSIVRDDQVVIECLLEKLLQAVNGNLRKDFDLKALDGFIEFLFLRQSETVEEANRLVVEDRAKRDQYKCLEDEFAENRKRHAEYREAERGYSVCGDVAVCTYVERILALLKACYNLYRNLENIPAVKKEEYLSRILDFHMYCNLMLIQSFKEVGTDKELSSIIAYIVTMSGQIFLRMELFSPTLRKTIMKLMGREQNDFKRFLLLSLYIDGRFEGFESRMTEFANETYSQAAIEMLYTKARWLVVTCREKSVPDKLMRMFKDVVTRRISFYKNTKSSGDKLSREVTDVKKQHLENYHWGDRQLLR